MNITKSSWLWRSCRANGSVSLRVQNAPISAFMVLKFRQKSRLQTPQAAFSVSVSNSSRPKSSDDIPNIASVTPERELSDLYTDTPLESMERTQSQEIPSTTADISQTILTNPELQSELENPANFGVVTSEREVSGFSEDIEWNGLEGQKDKFGDGSAFSSMVEEGQSYNTSDTDQDEIVGKRSYSAVFTPGVSRANWVV